MLPFIQIDITCCFLRHFYTNTMVPRYSNAHRKYTSCRKTECKWDIRCQHTCGTLRICVIKINYCNLDEKVAKQNETTTVSQRTASSEQITIINQRSRLTFYLAIKYYIYRRKFILIQLIKPYSDTRAPQYDYGEKSFAIHGWVYTGLRFFTLVFDELLPRSNIHRDRDE